MSKKKIKSPKPTPKPPERIVAPMSAGRLRKQLGFFIAVFSFVLYAQSITFDYAYDDITVIQGNRLIKEGIKAIPDLMSSDYWYGFSGNKEGAIYRPASLIMFAIEWTLFPDNPMPSHLINVVVVCFFLCPVISFIVSVVSKQFDSPIYLYITLCCTSYTYRSGE